MRRCLTCDSRFEGPGWRCPACGFTPQQAGPVVSFTEPEGLDGFDPASFEHLAELEHSSFWFRSRSRLIAWALERYFPSARRLLEIGCGTGYVLESLRLAAPRLSLAGAELHGSGLTYAAQRVPDSELFQFDAREIPFAAEFDVVGAFDVLEHIEEDQRVLAQMHETVKPGGGIMLTVPQHRWLWSETDEYAEHKRRYRRGELSGKVAAAGFRVLRTTSFVSFLLPAMLATRMANRLSRRPFDPSQEHRAAERATRPLELVVDFERSLIGRGVDLPAGGSLLLVAARR